MSDKYQFLFKLGEIANMLSKVIQDANPEMKTKSARFAGILCVQLGDKAGAYMKAVVASLVRNLHHQHSKVRKQTLMGLRDVLVCRGVAEAGGFDEALPQLKFAMNDRSQDVRQTFYEVLGHWLTHLEMSALR